MKIAHLAPFAPSRCGLYEAARDFVRADRYAGRDAELCDTGADGGAPVPGQHDDRSGERVTSRSWDDCKDADVFVVHGAFVDRWLVQTDAPVVIAIHGRPQACFKPEQNGEAENQAFSWMVEASRYQRVKAMLTMWSEHVPYWSRFLPEEKLVTTDDPPIDCEMFTPEGVTQEIPPQCLGKHNMLICDSWRSDVDCFEAAVGSIHAARAVPGLKVHFFGVEHKDGKPPAVWEHIFSALRAQGSLGLVNGRILEIASVYRAMDLLLSPHRIGVRTIGEALASGIPVVAEKGCRYTPHTAQMQDPEAVAFAVKEAIENRTDPRGVALDHFALPAFGDKLTHIYQDATALPFSTSGPVRIVEKASA
ncbi:MAG: glycosyltransferase family 4 protein [bacterium]|nr:glycosyltransferase family 4 protein [bacterium]